QAPTGIITGTVTDESGAVIPNAKITITNKATDSVRSALANAEGFYSAPALPAGDYVVRCEQQGFRTLVRAATVEAGSTTSVNLPMQVGGATEVVNVEAAGAQINYESHSIQGVIESASIENLPLNGRSYMQLAKLEPGVTIASGSVAQFNTLFTVSVLGAGNRTLFTLDGGNVSDNIDVGGGMSSMNLSQESVQEFQLSSVNFDLSTGIAAGGAVNVVTKAGTNQWHGDGYYYFRDHNMAAYPGLVRNPANPNPFFARRNPGATLGGPLKKDRLFFFFNYEYMNQVQALTIQSTDPAFLPLTGTYGSPYIGKTLSLRIDDRLSDKHSLFLRYSHDGNSGFGQSLEFGDPSNWAHNTNWADQSIIGITSTLKPTIVNDLRFQYNYWNNHNTQPSAAECSAPCVAGSLPNVFTFVGSNMPAVGPNFNAPQGRNTRRFEVIESLIWQKGKHRFKFGGDLNPTKSAGLWGFCTPMCVGAYSPTYIRNIFGAATPLYFPTLPTALKTDADVLNLPVLNINSSIFSGIGVGAISTPAPYGYASQRYYDQYRAYFQDTWKITPRFTLNYGLAWNAQKGFYNSNLAKPQYLAPILGTGSDNLGPTVNNTKEFQPAFGFAWSPFKDNKTVFRGGAGIYWDSTPGYYKLREAPVIGPVGNGRSTLAASAFTNIYPGIINFATNTPLAVGANLSLSALYNMTIGQFVNLVNQELPDIQAKLAPANPQRDGPFTVSGIDVAKQGVEIYPTHFPLARSYQTSVGIQRDLGHGMVLTADWARRQGENVSLSEVDYNLFNRYINGVQTPVIRKCATSEVFVPGIECSSGTITFWTDQGRAVYDGLLVKLSKRFQNHYQFTASYALQKGLSETVWDDTNWMAGYGQYLPHHNLNVAGTVELRWGFTISVNSSIISRTPVTANVSSLELPGTVNAGSTEPLPGLTYGCLNAGCGKADVTNAVNAFNTTYAGQKNANGGTINPLALPSDYQLGDPTFTQDFRVTKVFRYKERARLSIFGEVFNAFNIANLSGYSSTLDTKNANPAAQTFSFGQPTQRVVQTFGSGGPRAFQLGARFSF
ncbi:MAG: carboxypeptidase regulatory-like domain-containing protein, partial [Acidobacteriia bacterium]|nr:carboxypeptidase regulatory-like domain-containing protein [Terriglobia bacterium]